MKKLGLIGYPLGHSFSKKYFSEKFIREGIEGYEYETYPLASITELTALLARVPELVGLNVTIPYKELVTGYLHERSAVVKKTGACNCISIEDGKLIGHNTDVIGFEQSLRNSFPNLPNKALVFGTGGAAKAVEYVLRKLAIEYKLVSRKPGVHQYSYEQVSPEVIRETKLLINTTPTGMAPHITEAPQIPYENIGPSHCLFDLIYNPERTLFLQKGEQQGATVQNGMEMLVLQAEESWKIWSAASGNSH